MMDIDECWRSSYRDSYLGRSGGDDNLGYDFALLMPSRRQYYEVKASAGDEWQFDLGESEVRMAQRCSADRKSRYRIVFIANVLDRVARRLLVLPNPFSRRGTSRLRMVGTGMRFTFRPR
jgi:hypothetical protein